MWNRILTEIEWLIFPCQFLRTCFMSGVAATSNIPLSSPERNGSGEGSAHTHTTPTSPGGTTITAASKIDFLKAWTINTYKCTRQMVSERLGRTARTVDAELEAQIETLRDTQRKYANILRLARALSSHFQHVVATQRQLGDAFCEMSQKNPELQNEFQYNSETQKVLCKNGETLLGEFNLYIILFRNFRNNRNILK